MAGRVLMPKGSDTMTEGKVLKWLKHEGETVSPGEAVVEIETDKVNMEVEALSAGALRKIMVGEGQTVPVGQLLAVIAGPDEDISVLLRESSPAPPAVPSAAEVAAPPAEETAPQEAPGRGRVLASPLARRMAEEMGLDLAHISGTGPGGRIVREDVERAAAAQQVRLRPAAVPAAAGPVAPPVPEAPRAAPLPRPAPGPEAPDFHDEPVSSMRKAIAARMAQSLGPVPHFYLTVEIDMKRAMELRESANTLNPELKLTYNDISVKACAAALRLHPEVNASFLGDAIRYHDRIHVGVAVAVEGGGLITPVIFDCDRKSLQEISREAKELIARARSRKLKPEEYVGATFTVTNLGMMGIEEFSAVINPPEGAILAVGAVIAKPAVVGTRIEVGHRVRMTLSCDHRVVDGATGAKFLQTLKKLLENPVYLAF